LPQGRCSIRARWTELYEFHLSGRSDPLSSNLNSAITWVQPAENRRECKKTIGRNGESISSGNGIFDPLRADVFHGAVDCKRLRDVGGRRTSRRGRGFGLPPVVEGSADPLDLRAG